MDLKLDISGKQIEKYVADKILESGLGTTIEKVLQTKLSDWLVDGYDSPVKKAMKEIVLEETRRQLNLPENRAAIGSAIAEMLTPDAITKIIASGVKQIERNADY